MILATDAVLNIARKVNGEVEKSATVLSALTMS